MAITTVGVLGNGLMGSGIAHVCGQAGLHTIVVEVDQPTLDRGMGRIRKFLNDGIEKGKVTPEQRDATLGNLTGTTRIGDLAPCDLVLDAIRAHEQGLGSVEDIDKGMALGCGHPMGPFTLLDFVGLDTTYYIANIMFEEFRQPAYAPPPLLKRLVLAGRTGRKAGRGFYDYTGKQ